MTTIQSEALSKLSSPDHLELLNAIDSLRLQGINRWVSLPQIIVCGDQSSGKSSVLEALAGVPFPVNSTLCTRVVTELVLRRDPYTRASVSIKPGDLRPPLEREAISSFTANFDGFDALPKIIERAQERIFCTGTIYTKGKTFSKDVLRIELSGPNYPHLTIVDLPGLIHSQTKKQTAADVELVQEVVKSYMKESRSIILAVISAKNDFANQVVLRLARKADLGGQRTLGVITKPDTLTHGSGSESLFVSLAQNREIRLCLGWHVLKNLDSEKSTGGLAVRDAEETDFFSNAPWSTLPTSSTGIDQLRSRLSKLLLKQISSELPGLIHEIQEKYTDCQVLLEKRGSPRTTETEQRRYLVEVSQSLQTLLKSALDGTYESPFFSHWKTEDGYTRRLRAGIQNLNTDFAETMRRTGQHRKVLPRGTSNAQAGPNEITESDFLRHIETVMRLTRGRELPGTTNPVTVMELFREQCGPWEERLSVHVDKVWHAADYFLNHALAHVADESAFNSLKHEILEPSMRTIRAGLDKKAAGLLRTYRECYPITNNRYFTETLQAARRNRLNPADPGRIISEHFGRTISKSAHINGTFNLEVLVKSLTPPDEPAISRHAAIEAMDCLNAYYPVALETFVDIVCVQVVEEGLVAEIGRIFSPSLIYSMDSAQVQRLGGKSDDIQTSCEELNKQLEILKKGLETCKKFLGFRTA
ncbi:P-loop containing nucleoside triphosphate hydrolase protein [Naviculisporaceae sp. PSN 640]